MNKKEIKNIKAKARYADAMMDKGAPVTEKPATSPAGEPATLATHTAGKPSTQMAGKRSGDEEEFWVRCWDRKRGLSGRIFDLAEIGCTADEISAALELSPEFVRTRYGHELRRGLARLRARLRRLLLKSAEEGKVPAQVWLGHLLLARIEEQRQSEAPRPPGKKLVDMTTSEMLEEFVASAVAQGRG